MSDPIELEARRALLAAELAALRAGVADLAAGYRALPEQGVLLDTPGIGALMTPGYCVAGAREVLEEAAIELAAAADALHRAGEYTGRLRPVVFD
ncbi:hypothetical protein AB0H71_04820 [Nocardia sp. NPDC050697]|uniref:hypothetical protein n=1 Tax=Nocardia sp. NPDC050697 TaxID=3155158 RepID=UPI0033E62756